MGETYKAIPCISQLWEVPDDSHRHWNFQSRRRVPKAKDRLDFLKIYVFKIFKWVEERQTVTTNVQIVTIGQSVVN